MLRRRRREADPFAAIDPATVSRRFAGPVADAVAARARWTALVAGMRDGALCERLHELSAEVDAGTLAVWETARRAGELEGVVAALDADRVTDEYKRARRDPNADPQLLEALQSRFASVQRILNAIDDAADRLAVLDARLGAAVAHAAELILTGGAGVGAGAGDLADELGGVVGELDALRRSLDELG